MEHNWLKLLHKNNVTIDDEFLKVLTFKQAIPKFEPILINPPDCNVTLPPREWSGPFVLLDFTKWKTKSFLPSAGRPTCTSCEGEDVSEGKTFYILFSFAHLYSQKLIFTFMKSSEFIKLIEFSIIFLWNWFLEFFFSQKWKFCLLLSINVLWNQFESFKILLAINYIESLTSMYFLMRGRRL